MTVVSDRGLSTAAAGTRSVALRALPVTAFTIDLAVAFSASVLGAVAHLELNLFPQEAGTDISWVWMINLAVWMCTIAILGGYSPGVFGAGTDEYKRVWHAGLLTAGVVGLCCFLADFPLSRSFFVVTYLVGIPALVTARAVLRRAVHRARSNGNLLNRVLIVGSPSHVDEIACVLNRERWLGYRVVGALTPPGLHLVATASGIPVLGDAGEVASSVRAARADVVFFVGGAVNSAKELRRLAWELEQEDTQLVVAPSVTDVSSERVRIRPVGGLPLIHVDPPRALEASRWGKRLFDIVGSAGLIALFIPVFLAAAVWIRVHDGGPVLFRQTRVGKDGQTFSCLKFRSMVVNAEEMLAELHATYGYDGGLFKLKDDPRITRPGAWLRKHSLDELPQLINVLRGDMSLVGPRPPLPLEVERYEEDDIRRLNIRPGLTGLWQVSGRSDLSWEETIRLDLYYVDNWSMLQDVNIMLKTARAVLRPSGAY